MQQEAGQDCGNFTPAHVVYNRTTPPGAIEALQATLFNPMKDTVEDLRVPHIRNVENDQQMTGRRLVAAMRNSTTTVATGSTGEFGFSLRPQ